MYYDIDNSVELETLNQVRKARPSVSFHKQPTEEQLLALGIATVVIPTYIVEDSKRVIGQSVELIGDTYTLVYQYEDIPAEELIAQKQVIVERSVQNYINTTVIALGYDDENSIAKYLVDGNAFYTECKAISLWIGSVWAYIHQVQADVVGGIRTEPTLEELISELPSYES